MKIISVIELKNIIRSIIDATIDIHRERKQNTFFNEFHLLTTEDEIEEFIRSNPYFDDGLKQFLLLELIIKVQNMAISDEWECKFKEKIYLWSKSNQWLLNESCSLNKALDELESLGIFKIDMDKIYSKIS